MGLLKKIIFLSVITVAVALIIVNTGALNLLGKPIDLSITENAVIRKVSFDRTNGNILLLDIQSMSSKTIVLNTAVIKNSAQNTVATIAQFQNDLPANQNTTISVDLSNILLTPGNYTVNLWTTKSHIISSPTFAIPPN